MIRVRQVSVNVDKSSIEDIKNNTAKKLKINPNDILNLSINKESIDARYKPDLYYIYEVDIEVKNENAILKKNKSNDILKTPNEEYSFNKCGSIDLKTRPIIVGSGPAGLMASYILIIT